MPQCFTRSSVISLPFLSTKTTRPEYFCCSAACRSCDQILEAAAVRTTISFYRILYEGTERDQGVGGCGGGRTGEMKFCRYSSVQTTGIEKSFTKLNILQAERTAEEEEEEGKKKT